MQITNKIHFRNLQGDLFGGVTAAVIALPMALAFGIASGAGATAGLWGAVIVGFFAALFGGTPTLISEPTGPMTVVQTAVIASLVAADPDNGLAMAFTVVMMAGLFQIAFGLLKLGKYVTMMPYTVISGFMSGIGIILVILQLAPFLGQASPKGGVIGTLQALPNLVSNVRPVETLLALMTVGIIWFMPSRWKKFAPPQLVALVLGTIISITLFGDLDIRRIGEIQAGLPALQLPVFQADQLQRMLIDAAVLGMLGCIDALLTSVVADSLTRTEHNSNKELVGQGIGNVMSGLFGGLGGAGATMGTVVNIQSGGRTALSGLIRAMVLLVVILGAAKLAATIPLAVLAGIAFKVGVDIIDWGFLKRAHHVSIKGALIMYAVIVLTVLVDLIAAVGIGVFIANILTIDRMSALQSKAVKSISDADDEILLSANEKRWLDEGNGRVLLFQLSGPMIFGVAKAIAREHNAIQECAAIVFDLSDVPHLGVTASLALENAIEEAAEKGRAVYIVGATGQTKRRLEKLQVFRFVPESNCYDDRSEALKDAVLALGPHESEDSPSSSSVQTTY
ncbi:low affinity sulfate transporter [Synechocystis sp. PCC 6803]|uniref:Bicarbonate transporter BicA n=2 Tax=unclassified Synechocystis TaxID=2640012 RepID=BICA_SYNY3|nr:MULTISPECIES: SulP family inorganic anion transporter [unclassified Synechocystis]Q55415.1 RecName: Full=Bicarbonate transporter BicA [Synechocystis sp. PCC 6803 substr. Kazusa]BAM53892.1 bicarbonate transporter [Synechocystis sp. PCC 6803] [Bacillus subtilis BEST7613]AGF52804.1 low affinity sulfate transporter [Synechocystis sp. PCC 6803]ALJ68714.1 Bicarbonate transporter BicA [Synechocystis sp. PCC 6803]AVP90569.1 SulP family inorganic anion transporter [Synechocystis sp. IPPAS B-1465]MB